MYTTDVSLRVRYAETDQMGFVYYGNYATYFEVARTDALRRLGVSYQKIEQEGIWMPVLTFHVKYLKPAHYDDLLTVRVRVPELPQSRIRFDYELLRGNECLSTAYTILAFVSAQRSRPLRVPRSIIEALATYF